MIGILILLFTASMVTFPGDRPTPEVNYVNTQDVGYIELLFDDEIEETATFCTILPNDAYKIYPRNNDIAWEVTACYYVKRVKDDSSGDAELL